MHGDGYGTGSRPDVRKSKKIILTLQIKKTQKLETRCVSSFKGLVYYNGGGCSWRS